MDLFSISVAVSIIALAPIAVGLLYLAWRGGVSLYAKAAGRGSRDVAVYGLAWLIVFPFMLIYSVFAGVCLLIGERKERIDVAARSRTSATESRKENIESAASGAGLYEEEMSEYEKRRGY